ncbi:hypothetical protein GCM10023196_107760 [Actinoallomurus vinaceus]|uniref:ABC transmembrane type-1 domain-containing protein n=1 Tax=Actinoallomurus vinaceus TaxID=1080074 RepID=A0ABP8UVV5_9ACTN
MILPWATLRLAGRFVLPLALWYTVGQALRYALFYSGYRFGLHNAVVPVFVMSFTVLVTLSVTVLMVHSVKDGLPAVREHELDESLAPWAVQDEETILDALARALLPFMIFYLAWNWFTDDARDYSQSVTGRGFGEQGIGGQLTAMKSISALERHMYIAIALTAVFLIAKFIAERVVEPRWARTGGMLIAFCEVNWTLFGLFTVNQARNAGNDWLHGRVAWGWLTDLTGPLFGWVGALWPSFKEAVLGSLVWLVIAGVILGVDAAEEAALGSGRLARRIIAASGMDRPRTPLEVLTRELRDKWLPTVYGVRMIIRAGILPFGVFCALFTGLEVVADLGKRGVYDLLGPHPIGWWEARLSLVDFGVDFVHQVLRVCLMAAAFDLVVARVNARRRDRAVRTPSPSSTSAISPAAPS